MDGSKWKMRLKWMIWGYPHLWKPSCLRFLGVDVRLCYTGSHESRLSNTYDMCEIHNCSYWLNAIDTFNGFPHGKMFASQWFLPTGKFIVFQIGRSHGSP